MSSADAGPADRTTPDWAPLVEAPTVADCRFVDLPRIADARGALSFVEGGGDQLPFDVARVFYMYDLAPGATRGAHAHRASWVAIFMLAGGCRMLLDDGRRRERVSLDRPQRGLLVGPRIWHTLADFAPRSVCLALASHRYDEADYMRDYDGFQREVGGQA